MIAGVSVKCWESAGVFKLQVEKGTQLNWRVKSWVLPSLAISLLGISNPDFLVPHCALVLPGLCLSLFLVTQHHREDLTLKHFDLLWISFCTHPIPWLCMKFQVLLHAHHLHEVPASHMDTNLYYSCLTSCPTPCLWPRKAPENGHVLDTLYPHRRPRWSYCLLALACPRPEPLGSYQQIENLSLSVSLTPFLTFTLALSL